VGEAAGAEDEDALVGERREEAADHPAEPADPAHGHERFGDPVDEDRDGRHGVDAAEEELPRLDGAVVDLHPTGDGHVDVAFGHPWASSSARPVGTLSGPSAVP
jgi:hypothetical protein